MKKAIIIDTHNETKASLKKAKSKYKAIPKTEQKINTIMLCMDGYGVREICKLLNMTMRPIGKYIREFNDGGLEKQLKYGKAYNQPTTLTEAETKLVKQAVLSTPKAMGCGISENWTSPLLQTYIQKEFGKSMSTVGIQKMLHRLGFSYTRPTYVLAKADKKNQ